jgi:hypothetical protein
MKTMLSPRELEQAVAGDLDALASVLDHRQHSIGEAARAAADLVVTPDAVRSVLRHLRDGGVSPEHVQRWASFVRRGYVAGQERGPVQPIKIEYEAEAEDELAEIIARLDELGDRIDGQIDSREIDGMLHTLDAIVSASTVR